MKLYRSLYLRWVGATALAHVVAILLAVPFPVPFIVLLWSVVGTVQYQLVLRKIPGIRRRLVWPVSLTGTAILSFGATYLARRFELPAEPLYYISMGTFFISMGTFFALNEMALFLMLGAFSRFTWSLGVVLSGFLTYAVESVGLPSCILVGDFNASSMFTGFIRGTIFGAVTGPALLFALHLKSRRRVARMPAIDPRLNLSPPADTESTR